MGPVLAMTPIQILLLIAAVIIVLLLVVRLAGRKPTSEGQSGGAPFAGAQSDELESEEEESAEQ